MDTPNNHTEIKSAFQWPEDQLHTSLGVSRRILREKRALCASGDDWALFGNEVRWSEGGVKKLADLLTVENPEHPPNGEPVEPIETLTVASWPAYPDGRHIGGRSLIRAKRANGELVTVRVPDPSKFVPVTPDGAAMTLPAERSQYGWTLLGKAPRWRGRW